MSRPSKMLAVLSARARLDASRGFAPDVFEPPSMLTPEEELEQRRSELRNGLTDMQRLFLFGKLSGLNDKDAAITAGYSVSVVENTKQRIGSRACMRSSIGCSAVCRMGDRRSRSKSPAGRETERG
jgi:hypothetical protein